MHLSASLHPPFAAGTPGLPQHDVVWGSGPRLGGGGLLLR
jgi:hypothetical protein